MPCPPFRSASLSSPLPPLSAHSHSHSPLRPRPACGLPQRPSRNPLPPQPSPRPRPQASPLRSPHPDSVPLISARSSAPWEPRTDNRSRPPGLPTVCFCFWRSEPYIASPRSRGRGPARRLGFGTGVGVCSVPGSFPWKPAAAPRHRRARGTRGVRVCVCSMGHSGSGLPRMARGFRVSAHVHLSRWAAHRLGGASITLHHPSPGRRTPVRYMSFRVGSSSVGPMAEQEDVRPGLRSRLTPTPRVVGGCWRLVWAIAPWARTPCQARDRACEAIDRRQGVCAADAARGGWHR